MPYARALELYKSDLKGNHLLQISVLACGTPFRERSIPAGEMLFEVEFISVRILKTPLVYLQKEMVMVHVLLLTKCFFTTV